MVFMVVGWYNMVIRLYLACGTAEGLYNGCFRGIYATSLSVLLIHATSSSIFNSLHNIRENA